MRYFLPVAAVVGLLAQLGYSQPSTNAGMTARAAARFLDQATWGPTPASIVQLQQMGIANWLNAQFALNTSDLPDQPILNAAGKSNNNLTPVQAAFFQNAVTGQDQLRQRVAFVLSQIWVVSATSGVSAAYAYPPYWRIFRDNAFGNYRDLIKAVTLSPAMGRYLNMANNVKGNPAKGTAIPLNLFSHSDQQLAWQTSVAQGHSPTGWAGRAADYIASQSINSSNFPTFFSVAGNALEGTGVNTQPVALAPGQSLQLAGFDSSTASQERLSALNTLLQTESGVSLVQAAKDTLSNSISDAAALAAALAKSTPLKTQFPATGIGAQLQQVAQIIQVQSYLSMRRQIFFCSLGGFDTHAGEIETHNNLYPQLSPALSAFYDATQELGMAQNVTTFTESDFSRTFQPTTDDGSDHAWGSHHLVLGGAVQGGQIFGKFPTFQLAGPDDADVRGRWIPTTSIDQYGATLCSWFGIPGSALAAVFPNLANFPTSNLGFLG